MSSDAVVYLVSAMLGALVGGLASFAVSARGARRDRRARYGEAMLETLGAAHRKLAETSTDRGETTAGLNLRDEAINLWAQTELAATLEWPSGRRAMRAWIEQLHDDLAGVEAGDVAVSELEHRLDLGVYLVIAWTAGEASGTDFARPADQIAERFGLRRDET